MTGHELFRLRFCPFAHAAQLALTAAGVPVEVVTVTKEAMPPWLRLASPFGTVPLLRFPDGGTLSESAAIADYAARVTGTELIPHDAREAAAMREAVSLLSEGYRHLSRWRRRHNDVVAAEKAVASIAAYLAARVARPWFFGESFTLVDVFAVPFLRRRHALLQADGLNEPQAELAQWKARLDRHVSVCTVDATLEEETAATHLSYAAQGRPAESTAHSNEAFS